jgi:hypothetical protein
MRKNANHNDVLRPLRQLQAHYRTYLLDITKSAARAAKAAQEKAEATISII